MAHIVIVRVPLVSLAMILLLVFFVMPGAFWGIYLLLLVKVSLLPYKYAHPLGIPVAPRIHASTMREHAGCTSLWTYSCTVPSPSKRHPIWIHPSVSDATGTDKRIVEHGKEREIRRSVVLMEGRMDGMAFARNSTMLLKKADFMAHFE